MADLYDLVLLLDTSTEDGVRTAALDGARSAIQRDGELALEQAWGTRPLAYEIAKKKDAEYHLLQFTGPASLLETLDRDLRIADGVLRHRIVKILPGTPPAPSEPPPVVAGAGAERPERPDRAERE